MARIRTPGAISNVSTVRWGLAHAGCMKSSSPDAWELGIVVCEEATRRGSTGRPPPIQIHNHKWQINLALVFWPASVANFVSRSCHSSSRSSYYEEKLFLSIVTSFCSGAAGDYCRRPDLGSRSAEGGGLSEASQGHYGCTGIAGHADRPAQPEQRSHVDSRRPAPSDHRRPGSTHAAACRTPD